MAFIPAKRNNTGQLSLPPIVLIVVVFTLVLIVGAGVNSLAADLPIPVPSLMRLLITITIQVTVMTYWRMPRLTRLLARWIYPLDRSV